MIMYWLRPIKLLAFFVEHLPKLIHTKKVLYISLIKSTLTYCSPIWHPQYLKDIQAIENVQRRATKFILHDYASSYKSRLLTLHLLPLMMQFEINDILFFITSIKNPTKRFNILHYVTFSTASTRSSSKCKLCLERTVTDISISVASLVSGILYLLLT